jgi:hypothetical protein
MTLAPSSNRSGRGGGAAMAGGQRFQAQVTAWWAARVLLQTQIGQPYGLPAVSVAERIYCETDDSVDDVRIEVSNSNRIFGQCKTSLSLSKSADSEWASVLSQFYGELVRPSSVGCRFVMFYEKTNGSLEKLKMVLDRYRQLPSGTSIVEAAKNASERSIVNDLNSLLEVMQGRREFPLLAENREELLHHIYIKQLRLQSGDPDYLGVADALQEGLLLDPTRTTQTLHSLHRLADDLLADRGSMDRQLLRERLIGEDIALRDSVTFRSDFEKLDHWSSTELAAHEAEGRTRLVIGPTVLTLNRPVVSAMMDAALKGSFIVAGLAGSGKSGCLIDLANRLRTAGYRVWYWAANSLPDHSVPQMATHLQLEHAWSGILAEAATGQKPVIIVDSLDGLRDTRAQVAYRKFFAIAMKRGVSVVASIRSFDLQYTVELEDLFPRVDLGIPARFTAPALDRFCHISVSELGAEEFPQILSELPEVWTVLRIAPQLWTVVLNLFSLELLCKLISGGELIEDFTSISTQAELFERYWRRRITKHSLREEMSQALTDLIEQMAETRTLQVVPATWPTEVKTALFSEQIVRHPNSAPGRLPEDRLVEFNHHLLFDYAAELLYVRPRRDQLPQELSSPDTWGLFLRPSLLLFWHFVWKKGRLDFWDTLIKLEEADISILHKLSGYMAAAELANNIQDLQPLMDGCLDQGNMSQFWLRILRGIVSTASFMSLPGLFNEGRGDFWLQFAKDLVTSGSQNLINEGQWLLSTAARFVGDLSSNGKSIFNDAAIILRQYYTQAGMQPSHALRFAIEWICLSAEVNREGSVQALREAIATDQLQSFGYIQAYAIADQIDKIWLLSSELAVEIYDAIFGYVERETTQVHLDSSQILGYTAAKSQEYQMAQHLLTWKFGEFMSALPREATQAVIRVLRHYRDQERPLMSDAEIKTFVWNGRECRFQADFSSMWDVHDYDDPEKLASTWSTQVTSLAGSMDALATWDRICEVIITENELAAIWRRLLFAAARSPEFYAPRMWTMLTQPVILAEDDTEEAVTECIRSFTPYLSEGQLNEIQAAILGLNREQMPHTGEDYANRRLVYLKIEFLMSVPEERRSPAARDFLSRRAPESLAVFEGKTAEGLPDPEPTRFMQFERATAEAEANGRERELLQDTAPFMQLSTSEVTDDRVAGELENLQTIDRLLEENRNEISASVARKVENRLLRGFTIVAASDAKLSNETTENLFNRFRTVLTQHEGPEQDEDPFDAYRLAAKGVLGLSKKAANLEGLDTILMELANHTNPSVRLVFAKNIWTLFELHAGIVWATLEGWTQVLPTQSGTVDAVRAALVDRWFLFLRNRDAERADRLVRSLWRAAHIQGNHELRRELSELVTALWVQKREESAQEALSEASASPIDFLSELGGIVQFAGVGLFPSESETEFLNEEQKVATSELLVEALSSAKRGVETYAAQLEKADHRQEPANHPDWVQVPSRMFSYISGRIRFSAERLSIRLRDMSAEDIRSEMRNWWSYTEPIIDVLLSIPHPSFAFNLVEGLERLIEFDFKKTLHWISRATTASAPAGFAGEFLAQSRVIYILERTLADHRVSLVDDQEVRADFLATLEAFLAVGDPRAMALATKLDSIYR